MTQFIDRPVSVTVTRMRQIDNLDRIGEADFLSSFSIDGRTFSGRKFEGKDDLNPGSAWSFTNSAGQSNGLVPFSIRVFEDDRGAIGGGLTTVDINPLAGKRDLDFFLNLETGEVFSTEGGSSFQRLGSVNQTITLRGAGDSSRGEISFVVNGTAGTEPANSVFTTPGNKAGAVGGGFFGQALITGDFNADGKADLVTGFPLANVTNGTLNGDVYVTFGSSNGLNRFTTQTFNGGNLGTAVFGSALAVGDINGDRVDDLILGGNTPVVRFGRAGGGLNNGQNNISKDPSFPTSTSFASTVAAGDFNGDGKDDVVMGDAFATVSGKSTTGAIQVNYGSASGVTLNRQVFHRDTPGILGRTDPNASFGSAIAAGDINGDGFEDLIIGAPGAPDSAAGAGVFHVLFGSATGLTTANNQLIGQSFSGQTNQSGDRFGAAIAVGDVNGDRIADVVVGAPGKNNKAGQVYVYHGRRGQPLSTVATRILTQPNLSGGAAEANDKFGTTLDVKDLNNDGFADLVIGAPGEDNDTGVAHVTFGSASGLSSNVRILQQGNAGIAGTREAGDRFGTGIAIGNFDGSGTAEIAISAPNESFGRDRGAGLVNIVPSVFTASSFSLSAIESTKSGSNRSDILRGSAANGILNGKGGNDLILTGGGNDLAMGGAGDDILVAGGGDDLLYGGKGRDTQNGGPGQDIFVLAPKEGLDLIQDFQVGKDFLGLARGLEFEDLQLVQRGSSTVVKGLGDRLAILSGVEASSLTADRFVQIGFTSFEDMVAPSIIS